MFREDLEKSFQSFSQSYCKILELFMGVVKNNRKSSEDVLLKNI
jgi:hypothetical protein